MDLSGFSVSPDPTEQQRVMLLSRSPSGPKKYFPIPVEHLEEEIRVRSADDCKRFREEFNVSAPGRGHREEQQDSRGPGADCDCDAARKQGLESLVPSAVPFIGAHCPL